MTSTIAKVAGKMYLCIRNRHITLLEQMDTTKPHKTSCQTWRLVFILYFFYRLKFLTFKEHNSYPVWIIDTTEISDKGFYLTYFPNQIPKILYD